MPNFVEWVVSQLSITDTIPVNDHNFQNAGADGTNLDGPARKPPSHNGSGKRHTCGIKVVLLQVSPALRFVSGSYDVDRG